jgi:PQQ-dependent catabolism-associated CXXCW motif protein
MEGGMRVLSVCLALAVLCAGSAGPAAAEDPPQPAAQQYFAEENADFGVKPQLHLQVNVGTPTPAAFPRNMAETLSTYDLDDILWTAPDEEYPLLIDVLNGEHKYTIMLSYYIPYGGQPGTFDDDIQKKLAADLAKLTKGRLDQPIVFFCLGARCWESYNAVLRAYHAGYRKLYWYRGGINAWMEAGLEVDPLY